MEVSASALLMLRAAPRITKESRSHAAFLVSVFMVFLRFVVVVVTVPLMGFVVLYRFGIRAAEGKWIIAW